MGIFKRKHKYEGLEKTKKSFGEKIKNLFKSDITEEIIEKIEEDLILSDVSVDTTLKIIKRFREERKKNSREPIEIFKNIIEEIMPDNNLKIEKGRLNIIFVFGVNGVGKTTTIAKLAKFYKDQGFSITLAAADTYRSGAVDQISVWAERVGVHLVKHEGKSKPSAVIFDAIDSAIARERDLLIVDTAGRLHNRENLIQELEKLNKILKTKAQDAYKYNLLVLDATTGQNALQQAKTFSEHIGIDGIFLSKIDSTAKGGIAITIANELKIPVVFVGTGEKLDDIEDFDKKDFVESIFE
ncbi:MAG TPA: signal recognition particle-docking protein FtsY [Spirochaetota bacterium]|nr:signal recognition particle-docking protein FtsY [Spirochaetota bacterium]HOM37665.1 signal recognition particle-docking protein FtsY [Spirochaetota bacterium]HPQ49623.1 signal recognition particle-docking protein FtsY [Spirochaetota bacterium]